MAGEIWGRDRFPTGESVAAALSLAKELKPDACLLCDAADESTELLVRKGGAFQRYVAYASGATEQVETRAPSRRYRAGRKLTRAGLAGIPVIVAAGFIFRPENSTPWMGGPLFIAFGLVLCGALISQDWGELAAPGMVSARIPYRLGGWEPRTVAQLAAVEDLCDAGDEASVRVRNVADGGVVVETFRKRERHRHLLDARGAVVEHSASPLPAKIYWARRFAGTSAIAVFVVFVLAEDRRFAIGSVAALVLVGLVVWRMESRKHTARPGEDWFKVQVEAPSD